MTIKLSKGPAAANIYNVVENDIVISHLLLDWSFNAIDFKYADKKWITLETDNIKSLGNDELKEFTDLANYAILNLNNFSEISDKTLNKLNNIINCTSSE